MSQAAYICDLLTPYEPDHRLRFSSRALLMVPKSQLVSKGDQAFAVWAPNSLPRDVRQANSVSSFKSTHFKSTHCRQSGDLLYMFISLSQTTLLKRNGVCYVYSIDMAPQ